MVTNDEALQKIKHGISMNAFFYEFEHEASILLDRLVHQKKVRIERSKKYQMHVIMPINRYIEPEEDTFFEN